MEKGEGEPTSKQELTEAFCMGTRLVAYHLLVLQHADLIVDVADERADETRYVASAVL